MIKLLNSIIILLFLISFTRQQDAGVPSIEMYINVNNPNLNSTTICGYSIQLACIDFPTLINNYQTFNVSKNYFNQGNNNTFPSLVIYMGSGDYIGISNISLNRFNVTINGGSFGEGAVTTIFGNGGTGGSMFSIIDNSTTFYNTSVTFNEIQFSQLSTYSLLIVDAPKSDTLVELISCSITNGNSQNSEVPYISLLPSATTQQTDGITRLNLNLTTVSNNSIPQSSIIQANFAFVQIHHSLFTMNSGFNGSIFQGLSTDISNFSNSFISPSVYINQLDLLVINVSSIAQTSFFVNDSIMVFNNTKISSDYFGCMSSDLVILGSTVFDITNSVCKDSDVVSKCVISKQSTSFSCDPESSSTNNSTKDGLSTKDKIIISVIFGLAGLFILILLIVWCYRRRHHHHHYQRF